MRAPIFNTRFEGPSSAQSRDRCGGLWRVRSGRNSRCITSKGSARIRHRRGQRPMEFFFSGVEREQTRLRWLRDLKGCRIITMALRLQLSSVSDWPEPIRLSRNGISLPRNLLRLLLLNSVQSSPVRSTRHRYRTFIKTVSGAATRSKRTGRRPFSVKRLVWQTRRFTVGGSRILEAGSGSCIYSAVLQSEVLRVLYLANGWFR